jgi:hypothetical protein
MARKNKKLFADVITELVGPHHFRRTSTSWQREMNDALLGVHLQRSRYAPVFFINFYAWYPKISDRSFESFLKATFHISSRGSDELIGIQGELLSADEKEVDQQQFTDTVARLWFDETLAQLIAFSSLDATRVFLQQNPDGCGFFAEHELIEYLAKQRPTI